MTKLAWRILCVGCLLTPSASWADAGATNALPSFQEVFGLVRTNLSQISEADLNDAAVRGLLQELDPQVSLEPLSGPAATDAAVTTKQTVFEGAFAYVRAADVKPGLADAIAAACGGSGSTNKIKGLVLDLRFAGGSDYADAVRVADRFLSSDKPLLEWEGTPVHSTAKSDAIELPVAVLTNRKTHGASEALAAVLRRTDVALLIGNSTAGQARVFKVFTLTNGRRLRVATAPVRYGDGELLPSSGLRPDIQVNIGLDDENLYLADAYRSPTKGVAVGRIDAKTNVVAGVTNRSPHRLNEAELVRLQKEGLTPDLLAAEISDTEVSPLKPVVRDPALARALDLLKGLAVVQSSRHL